MIHVIEESCLNYLKKQKIATRKEILIFVKSHGLVNVIYT